MIKPPITPVARLSHVALQNTRALSSLSPEARAFEMWFCAAMLMPRSRIPK